MYMYKLHTFNLNSKNAGVVRFSTTNVGNFYLEIETHAHTYKHTCVCI